MTNAAKRVPKTIVLSEDVHHQARIAALASRKNVGAWIEEAIEEKLSREWESPRRNPKTTSNVETQEETKVQPGGVPKRKRSQSKVET